MHTSAVFAAATVEYKPATQVMQASSPAVEYVPATHCMHVAAVFAATVVEYFPAGQDVQMRSPPPVEPEQLRVWYFPAAHGGAQA